MVDITFLIYFIIINFIKIQNSNILLMFAAGSAG